MAVAFDAVGPAGSPSAGVHGTTSPLSWTHVLGGTANAILVAVVNAGSGTNNISSVTIGAGNTNIPLIGVSIGNGSQFCSWYGLISPPTGSQTVKVNFTGTPNDMLAGSVSFTGASSFGTLFAANNGASSTSSQTVSVTGTTTGGMVAATCAFGGQGWSAFTTTGSGGSINLSDPNSSTFAGDMQAIGTYSSTGSAMTVGFSAGAGGTDTWSVAAVEVLPPLWVVVQSASSHAHGVTTLAATYPGNVTSGTKLIALVSCDTGGLGVATSVEDASLNALTEIVNQAHGSGVGEGSLWALDTPAGDAGGSVTLTATFSTTVDAAILIQEVSGLATGNTVAAMIDGTPVASSGSTANTVIGPPLYTDTAVNEYLVYAYTDDGATAAGLGTPAGYTEDAHNLTGVTDSNVAISYALSTNGTETGTYTSSTGTTGWTLIMAAFLLAGAAPPVAGPLPGIPLVSAVPEIATPAAFVPGDLFASPAVTSASFPLGAFLPPGRRSPAAFTRLPPRIVGYQVSITGTTTPLTLAGAVNITGTLTRQVGKRTPATVNVTGSTTRQLGKITSAAINVSGATVRQVSKLASGTVNVAGSLTRNTGKKLAGTVNVAAVLISGFLHVLALSGTVQVTGTLVRSIGRLLKGTANVTGSQKVTIGKQIPGTVNVNGTLTRSLGKIFSALVNVNATLGTIRVKLLTLSGTVNVNGSLVRSIGKIASGTVSVTGSLINSTGKKLSSAVNVTGSLVRFAGKILAGTVNVSATLTTIKSKLVLLVTTVNVTGSMKVSLGKIVSGTVNVVMSAANQVGKKLSGTVNVSATALRQTGKTLAATVNITGTISSIRVKLLTLTAAVNVTGAVKVSIGKMIPAIVNVTGAMTSRIAKIMSASAQVAGSVVRSLGKTLKATVNTAATAVITRVRLMVLSVMVNITGTQKVQVGKLIPGTVNVAASATRHIAQTFSAAVRTAGSILSARPVVLGTTVKVAGSIVANAIHSTITILFRIGRPARRWVTGTVKKNWRLP